MSSTQPLAEGEYLFTSESVTEGHPDKVCDAISDAVLDAVMEGDPQGRVACETLVNTGMAVVSGEISTDIHLNVPEIARETIREIGYDRAEYGYNCDHISVIVSLDKQSPDIAQGVDEAYETRVEGAGDELLVAGAGDQGMMFGYAADETEALMPMPIHLAHRLAERLAAVRKDGSLDYLGPDGKTQVTVRYADGRPVRVEKLLISTQHAEGVDSQSQIKPDLWEQVVMPVMRSEVPGLFDDAELLESFLVNPTGKFVIGGPVGDAGLTGRKIIVDTYGGMARHGGGAFSGKDPSKVDRSAAYAARYVAKNVVAAGLATGTAAIMQVFPTTSPQDQATEDLVTRLRDHIVPDATRGTTASVAVGGFPAAADDFASYTARMLPIVVGFVLLLSFVLLMIVFRSLLVPLKAVIMNLLSVSAAYGVMVAVFQWGWGISLIGVGKEGPIESWAPLILFAVVFGLSMDYEVFLLSRIKEEYDRTGNNADAVANGLAKTARVITAAAAIMVCVFGAFVLGPERALKVFGLGMAVAVLIDATIVRLVLVPATMELLGDRNWWLPGWLDRILPRIHIEAHPDLDAELAALTADTTASTP